jgi:ABC-type transport system substrate-binding protein
VTDGLTTIGADGLAQAALAIEWKSDNNHHRWQFKLRPGVLLQNTEPLTAEMVARKLNQYCHAGCPWTAVRSVGSSIVFTSDEPMPNLPELLAGDEYLIGFDTDPPLGIIGTGPFRPDGAGVIGGVQRFIANEICWKGRPFFDAIEIHEHKSVRDQLLDLSVGRADLVEIPAEQLRQAREQHLNILASPPATLLALTLSDSGTLTNPNLRAAIALAVDRAALSNVIFQKQGEITASLLPASLTGYAFLFPADRDLNKAHELRGGLTLAPLTLAVEGGATMQLAAQRIALNLHDAGFNVTVATNAPHPDLTLRQLPLESTQPQSALESLLRTAGQPTLILDTDPAALYRAERNALETHTLIPLLYLPRAYAAGSRLRDLRLTPDGTPQLANSSLEDTP